LLVVLFRDTNLRLSRFRHKSGIPDGGIPDPV